MSLDILEQVDHLAGRRAAAGTTLGVERERLDPRQAAITMRLARFQQPLVKVA